jgi:ATP-dependent DNA helicase RecQ
VTQTELQVEDRADSLLAELGFTSWRPGQKEAVEAALAGRDSLIVMPTGGGKSLCYQLPGLATEDLTIVVSPLIALMND